MVPCLRMERWSTRVSRFTETKTSKAAYTVARYTLGEDKQAEVMTMHMGELSTREAKTMHIAATRRDAKLT